MFIPHHPFLRVQRPHKNGVHKDLRFRGGELGRERYPGQVIDVVLFKKKRLFLKSGKHRRSGFRLHHGARVRIEGDDDARKAFFTRTLHDLLYKDLVAFVDAVEIAHRDDGAGD